MEFESFRCSTTVSTDNRWSTEEEKEKIESISIEFVLSFFRRTFSFRNERMTKRLMLISNLQRIFVEIHCQMSNNQQIRLNVIIHWTKFRWLKSPQINAIVWHQFVKLFSQVKRGIEETWRIKISHLKWSENERRWSWLFVDRQTNRFVQIIFFVRQNWAFNRIFSTHTIKFIQVSSIRRLLDRFFFRLDVDFFGLIWKTSKFLSMIQHDIRLSSSIHPGWTKVFDETDLTNGPISIKFEIYQSKNSSIELVQR